ncbi:MAG: type II toxin-antitoxin system HicB family antitoxin [Candidatus Sulfotelmatobacter sp.]
MNPKSNEKATSYPVKIEFDEEDGLYIAEFPDLPGCSAPGGSVEEAYDRAQQAKEGWIRLAEEQGLPIPKPSRSEEHSGRILLRLPAALHGMLADRAKNQATSLNQYVVHLLSGTVVGDIVGGQVEQLKLKVASLESQLNQVAKGLEASYSQIAKQLAGSVGTGPTHPQTPGGIYAAVGGAARESNSIH